MSLRVIRPALLAASLVVASGVIAFAPVTAAPGNGARVAPQATRQPLPAPTDRFIVTFKQGALVATDARTRKQVLEGAGRKLGVTLAQGRRLATGAELLRTERKLDAHAAKALMLELRRDKRVASVEPDRLHLPLFSPNDPLYPTQHYLTPRPVGIGLNQAWDRGQGAGVVVAVLDSGITAHPDLDANVLSGGYDFISDPVVARDGNGRDANPADTGDWTTPESCPGFDDYTVSTWHGTAIAGVIAAATDNATGLAGAAPQARILPVRVLGKCGGYTSDVADAIVWSAGGTVAGVPANAHPAEVINLSLGTAGACGPTLQGAIHSANANGAIVVAAAGEGMFTNHDAYAPGNCDDVVSVGMSGIGGPVSNTGFGATSDLLAPPPYTIQVLGNSGTTAPADPNYGYGRGSSISAALVSGTLAIMQGIRPQSPAAAAALLRATALEENLSHKGVVDADAATLALATPTLVVGGWFEVTEGAAGALTPVTVPIHLTEPMTTPVTFTVSTYDETAMNNIDFVPLNSQQHTIAPGQTSDTVTVYVKDNDYPSTQVATFKLVFGNVQGATLVDYGTRVGITDNDAGPTFIEPTSYEAYAEDGNENRFTFQPPFGATNVKVTLTEAFDGDPDLYVRKVAPPTLTDYDCAANGPELDETCNLGAANGLHHIWVDLNGAMYANVRVSWHLPTSLSIGDVSVVEGDSGTQYVYFTVTREPVSSSTVTFKLATAAGTATVGSDYTVPYPTQTWTLSPGQPSRGVQFRVTGDTALEANETLTATLTDVAGATVVDGVATATLLNDDGPTLSIEDVTVAEGDSGTSLATFDVVLSAPAANAVTFNLATAADASMNSATAGEDYVATTWNAQSIAAGQVRKSFTFPVVGDAVMEEHETLAVVLSGASVSAQRDRATVTIHDNDGPELHVDDASISEGNAGVKVLTFNVRLDGANWKPVTFTARTVAGTATAGTDYRSHVVTGTIPAGMTGQAFSVAILGDTTPEDDETFQVVLSDVTGTHVGDGVAVGTIVSEELPPLPSLSIADLSINEGDSGTKLMTFTISLSRTSPVPVSFTATTANGTAVAPADYVARNVSGLTIPAGQLSRVFSITINGETTVEPLETFTVNLSNPSNAVIGDGQGIGYIINNDGALISINDVAVGEGNAGTKVMTFTVSLSQAAPGPVTYSINTQGGDATAGVDYQALNLTNQVIPQGQLSKTHAVTINGDSAIEPTEVLTIFVRQPQGASVWDGQGTGYILNDDGPTLSVLDASVGEGNSAAKFMNVTVLLSQASASPVTFSIATQNVSATAGNDYSPLNLTNQVIPAGQTSKVFQIPVAGDTVVEPNESFLVTLAPNPVGATLYDRQAIATIYNDDGPTLSINDVSVSEGQSGTKVAMFTVSLSQAATVPVTYTASTSNLTATAGSDYVATVRNETLMPGELVRTFIVPLNGDTTVEPNETFRATLSNISAGATLFKFTGTGTITNDD